MHRMNEPDTDVAGKLDRISRRLQWLTVAVFAMALALLFIVAGVLGSLIDFHFGEWKLIVGTCVGGAAMGFAFGWLAGRRA